MRLAIAECRRRREKQLAYNEEHGITPTSIVKDIDEVMASVYERDYVTVPAVREPRERFTSAAERDRHLAALQQEMRAAAANLDFEKAARLRDRIRQIRVADLGLPVPVPES
jgi:excinuclease ABC subunit B